MTVREMFSLTLILLAGLIFNRCAHLSGGQQIRQYEVKTQVEKPHAWKGENQKPPVSPQVDTMSGDVADEIEEAMEEAAESITESLEDVERLFNETDRENGQIAARRRISKAAKTYFFILGPTPLRELEVKTPPPDLIIGWDEAESRIRIELLEAERGAPVSVTSAKRDRATVSFQVPAERALIGLPEALSTLRLSEPFDITLRGGPDELEITTSGRGEVSLARSGGTLTISGSEWKLTAEGVAGEVQAFNRKGRLLRSLADGEDIAAPAPGSPTGNDGGGQ